MVMNMTIEKIIIYMKSDLLTEIFILLIIIIEKNTVAPIFRINNPRYSFFSLFLKNVTPFFNLFILYSKLNNITKINKIAINAIYSFVMLKKLNIIKFITVELKYIIKLILNVIVVINNEYPIFLFTLFEKIQARNKSKNIILIAELEIRCISKHNILLHITPAIIFTIFFISFSLIFKNL